MVQVFVKDRGWTSLPTIYTIEVAKIRAYEEVNMGVYKQSRVVKISRYGDDPYNPPIHSIIKLYERTR